MLEVKLLEAGAKAPTVANPGEDLGYDLYALEYTFLPYGETVLVRTGIAVVAYKAKIRKVWAGLVGVGEPRAIYSDGNQQLGLLIRDRSSIASKSIVTSGGVIDAGYRGEIKVLMTNWNKSLEYPYVIEPEDKIAQMIPVPVLTGEIFVVGELNASARGDKGFGSSGV